jgi:hypothetical protein
MTKAQQVEDALWQVVHYAVPRAGDYQGVPACGAPLPNYPWRDWYNQDLPLARRCKACRDMGYAFGPLRW